MGDREEREKEERKKERKSSLFFFPPPGKHTHIQQEAEDQGLLLPYACRMGCCTACAVRVKSGEMSQPEALGVAADGTGDAAAILRQGLEENQVVEFEIVAGPKGPQADQVRPL